MRVIVLVKATADSEAGVKPSAETTGIFAAMNTYNRDLLESGILLSGEGLQPSCEGKRIAFDGDNRTVIDGPFAATTELIAGFWIWQVRDMDEAIAWAKRCPNPMPVPSTLEIRRISEMDDIKEILAPGDVEREEYLRATLADAGALDRNAKA